MPEAHPLDWPEDWPIVPMPERTNSRFAKKSFYAAWCELGDELDRFGAEHVIISSDIPLKKDGSPRGNAPEPMNGAVAVYFHRKGAPVVIACDTYRWTYENARAIFKTVEAWRTIDRHGASQLLARTMSGFAALPPAADEKPRRPWWEVLELDVGEESLINPDVLKAVISDPSHSQRKGVLKMAEVLYKGMVSEHHPDVGGDEETWLEIDIAIKSARIQLGEKKDG